MTTPRLHFTPKGRAYFEGERFSQLLENFYKEYVQKQSAPDSVVIAVHIFSAAALTLGSVASPTILDLVHFYVKHEDEIRDALARKVLPWQPMGSAN